MKKCLSAHSLSDPGIFNDPGLIPHGDVISSRLSKIRQVEEKLLRENNGSLSDFADYHRVFGLNLKQDSWVFREWAPNALEIYIICEKTSWKKSRAFLLEKKGNGIFEKWFAKDTFSHGDFFKLIVVWPGNEGERIPTAAIRVVQDPHTLIFTAQVWHPPKSHEWKINDFSPDKKPLLIYETHVGMALEEGRIGTYAEFERHILPKIVETGYNTIQLMAIQEHPYYASFGYHVSSFFAASSRLGTPEELKSLVDAAHGNGIRVLMDIVHSHAVNNEMEGISKFDGTSYQFFHDGPRGYHRQWDSRCFDYGRTEVIRFLLSNLKFWMEEYKIDGFRFDGVTSMIFHDHGLGRVFSGYKDYYCDDVDVDALSYLSLANRLVHELRQDAVTIAEDVSGYPGLAAPLQEGGTGFDYRFAMGIADYWIKLLKDVKDEQWHLGSLWHELTTRRKEEKIISYAESHDQALVGDKTIMMHLMGAHIYTGMGKDNDSMITFRAVALHKMIRLITIAAAGSGYLNFMGNEFGHPEWIDFPCEKNQFSFHYARRQWSLKYDDKLYFSSLAKFDKEMIQMVKDYDLLVYPKINLLYIHEQDKVIAFERNHLVFVFNFNHSCSFSDYIVEALPGKYCMILNTDDFLFGGNGRLEKEQYHFTLFDPEKFGERNMLSLYLPTRTALVLKIIENEKCKSTN